MNMQDYKVRQMLFNKLHKPDDLIDSIEHNIQEQMSPDEIKDYCLSYLTQEVITIFPAKSYIVAVIYSLLIEKYFQTPWRDSLNENLFLGTDRFYIPYKKSPNLYESIVKSIMDQNLAGFEMNELIQVKKTVSYFRQEFLE